MRVTRSLQGQCHRSSLCLLSNGAKAAYETDRYTRREEEDRDSRMELDMLRKHSWWRGVFCCFRACLGVSIYIHIYALFQKHINGN